MVAGERNEHQLWKEPAARHMNQAPVELAGTGARRAQLDPDHQPAATYLLEHLVASPELREPIAEHGADLNRALDQAIALDDAERREARRHGQPIASVGRLMDVGALQRSHRPLVDLPPSDHGGHRHVAAAQRLSHEHEVRLEAPMLEREPPAGASQPCLNLVDDEQRAVAPAQLMRGPEVTRGRQRDHAALYRLDDERGHVLRPQLLLEPVEIAERNPPATRQQRTETLLEELVAHQGQRAERDPVKAAVAREQPGSAR